MAFPLFDKDKCSNEQANNTRVKLLHTYGGIQIVSGDEYYTKDLLFCEWELYYCPKE